MKTFTQVELHYRLLARDFPTNLHFCQIHNTIVSYAPDNLEGLIKSIRDHIDLKVLEAKKYRERDPIYVSECHKDIAADKEFLEFVGVSYRGQQVITKREGQTCQATVSHFNGDRDTGGEYYDAGDTNEAWVIFNKGTKKAGIGQWTAYSDMVFLQDEQNREVKNGE